MIGLPDETRGNIFETIELNKSSNPSLRTAGFIYPYPGTYVRIFCLEKGYIDESPPVVNYDNETIIRNSNISKKKQKGLQKLSFYIPLFQNGYIQLCFYVNMKLFF